MQHQIQQLKEEIAQKDKRLAIEHFDQSKMAKKYEERDEQVQELKKKLDTHNNTIQTLTGQLDNLQMIIAESHAEKAKQKKD